MMHHMRTTVTLEPDVAERIRKACLSGKRSQKSVINEALRRGLSGADAPAPAAPFRVRPIRSPFRAGVDTGKLNQLVDEMEAGSYLEGEAGR